MERRWPWLWLWLWRAAAATMLALGAANVWLYNYAAIHAQLHSGTFSLAGSGAAPHARFALFGDPQIEGDAKIAREPRAGKYDLAVNDHYLRHVYQSTLAAFRPHFAVTVGDIFSSQWVSKPEHARRLARYRWISGEDGAAPGQQGTGGAVQPLPARGAHEYLHLAGNHDIGYGDETRPFHIDRFVRSFGPLNREWTARVGGSVHRFAIVNAMNLDGTRHAQFRNETWSFVQELATRRAANDSNNGGIEVPLVLFLHIPLSKPAGVCVDSPETTLRDGFVRYQDYVSPAASAYLLHCLAPTLVLAGHDHDGCLAAYTVKRHAAQPVPLGSSGKALHSSSDLCRLDLGELDTHQPEIEQFALATVTAIRGPEIPAAPAAAAAERLVVEATVRSAMGAYSGASGILDIVHGGAPRQHRTLSVHVTGRGFTLHSKHGYTYTYREIRLGHHLAVRALVVASLVALAAAPALLLAR